MATSFTITLSPRRHVLPQRLAPRRHSIAIRTEFTTSPTGRIFNSRFSDRFKKS